MNKLYKILKPLIWLVLLIFTVVATLPKANLYYKLEEYLKAESLIIYDEEVSSSLFSINIDNGIINYKGIDGAYFKNLELTTGLVYNNLKLEKLKVNKNLQSLIPTNIDILNIKYSILNPIKVTITGKTQLGNLNGNINLIQRKINLQLNPTKVLNSTQKRLLSFMKYEKKSNKGVYTYEYSY